MPFFELAGQKLFFEELGQGTPIVLVHGYPLDGRVWQDVGRILSKSCRVIVPDLRGFGQSGHVQQLSMAQMAQDLVGLLDNLNIPACAFAGLSMGGYVLQKLTQIAPARISRLILVDTRANADAEDARKKREAMAAMVLEKGSSSVADAMMGNMMSPDHSPVVEKRLRDIMESQRPATLAAACLAMRDREEFLSRIPNLPMPLDVLVGDQDVISPLDVAKEMVSQSKHAQLHIIRGAGHMSPIEKPEEVSAALFKVLKS